MRAVLCRTFGPPDALEIIELSSPVAGPGQVVVAIKAAGVNYPDALVVQGKHQIKPDLPFVPGGELSGTVTQVGEGVVGLHPGQAVYGSRLRGSFAEEIAVDADKLRPIPGGMSFVQAACLSTVFDTSYYALVMLARLRAGETVLVLGAAGGVGLAAVEIAKALGARVIAAASGEEKLAVCKDHGADDLIDYSREDLRARIKALAGARGIDVVYDPVGGAYAEPALRGLAWRGRYLVVGFAAGDIPRLPLNLVLLKGASVIGVFLGAAWKQEPQVADQIAAGMDDLIRGGGIRPHICAQFGLERVGEALNMLLQRKVIGKIVLLP